MATVSAKRQANARFVKRHRDRSNVLEAASEPSHAPAASPIS
jgi:hypothetical protein